MFKIVCALTFTFMHLHVLTLPSSAVNLVNLGTGALLCLL